MRDAGARLLLYAAFGAVAALLVVLFLGVGSNSTVDTATPTGKTDVATPAPRDKSSERAIEAANAASDAEPKGDDSGRAGANEVTPAISSPAQSLPVAEVNTDRTGTDARRALASQSSAVGSGGPDDAGVPRGWCFRARSGFTWQESHAGPGPQHQFASDSRVVWQGSASARIGAAEESLPTDVVGVMWQAIVATPLRGKRVELSAFARSAISRPGRPWVGHLFVRTQGKAPLELMLSDQNAPSGARGLNQYVPRNPEWDRYRVVLEVPSDAEVMYYGFALYGGGYVWIDDVRISTADASAVLTKYGSVGGNPNIAIDPAWVLPAPFNLGFELTNDDSAGGGEAPPAACARESVDG
jgi:hypothetical protein